MRKTLLILFVFTICNTYAQKTYEFSDYLNKYPSELTEFLSRDASKDRKKEIEAIMLEFSAFWQSDTLSDENKKMIIDVSNSMSKKRFNASPTFYYFIDNVLAIKRDTDNADNFVNWMNSLGYYIKRKRIGYLNQYFQYSALFFKSHYIFDKSNKIWKLSNGEMKIEDDGSNNPVFVFDQTTLTGFTEKDSSYILRTSGKYYPLKQRWVGSGGKVCWSRLGLDTNTVYAYLQDYKIDLKTNLWRADSVSFYDRRKFDFPLEGKFRDKFGYSTPNKNFSYPSFNSYRYDLVLKDVFPDVDYQGSYTLQGLKVIGSGEGKENAYFIFKHKGTRFVWAGSQSFIIEDDKVLSEKVNVTVYLESVDSITGELTTDSIYHPGLSLYYSGKKGLLSIYRKEEGLSKSPFYDSYHKIDLYVEELSWKMGEDFIDMKALQQKGVESRAYFESINMFSNSRYERLKGLDRTNPVLELFNYTEYIGSDEFFAEEFGMHMKMGKAETIAYLMNMASKGFLIYEPDEDYVIVKENVRLYVLAHRGEVDYDVIGFNSTTDGSIPNASLNLRNNEIIIQGVGTVFLSDSQDVKILPKYGRIVLKKNRNFEFDGKIAAGRFDLYARECNFSYDKFELDLPTIDSMSFKVEAFEENAYGERPLVRVKTVIQDLKGNILIDHPNNKSGIRDFPEYPVLNSKARSYVYYDKSNIFGGVYTKDKFFYRLESFSIDSLDDFTTEGLQFDGYLASAGIFPDIEHPLMVQRDYSLGFVTTTGSAGYATYGGQGRYTDSIRLSNEGLRGGGQLEFLSSTSRSNDFFFFPDSVNAHLQSYEIEAQKSGVEYPQVAAHNVYEHWEPYNDLMETFTTKEEEPFKMYDSEATMLGALSLSSKELEGSGGIVVNNNAEMTSEVFKFNSRTYTSDSCIFRLRAVVDSEMDIDESLEQSADYAYGTEDMFEAEVDFDERKGLFKSKDGAKPVNFMENMYMCFMDQFTWYMDEDKTEFSSEADPMAVVEGKTIQEQVDLDLAGTRFISTHPSQDSLSFYASSAIYRQKAKLIHASGVPYINTADVAIYPGINEIKIYAKAEMDEITEAQVLVNRESKYHALYNGTFKVRGAHSYSGRALYDYRDEMGAVQNIYFGNIRVDTAGFTLAEAIIESSANFTLSDDFDFVGNVELIGGEKYLRFSGGTRINHDCDTLERPRIRFAAQIDPANIRIPIGEEVKSEAGWTLSCGLKAKKINGRPYSSFLDNIGSRSDYEMMQSFGYLMFDNIAQEYRIASEDKLEQHSLPGNYLSLSKRDCSVYGEGKIDLAFNTGHLEADAYGKARYFSREDSTSLNVSLPLNFYFNEKALEIFAADLNSRMDLEAVSLEEDVYKIMLGNKLGAEQADEVMGEIITNGGEYRKIPKELITTIFISDVKMKYNPRSRSFVSTEEIGIASIGKEQVLKYVEGRLEVKNKNGTYEITLAIDLGSKEYYFFRFKGNDVSGQVLVYASNEEFNTVIKETEADDRKVKTKGKEPKFNYYMSTPVAFKKFIRMMQMKE